MKKINSYNHYLNYLWWSADVDLKNWFNLNFGDTVFEVGVKVWKYWLGEFPTINLSGDVEMWFRIPPAAIFFQVNCLSRYLRRKRDVMYDVSSLGYKCDLHITCKGASAESSKSNSKTDWLNRFYIENSWSLSLGCKFSLIGSKIYIVTYFSCNEC